MDTPPLTNQELGLLNSCQWELTGDVLIVLLLLMTPDTLSFHYGLLQLARNLAGVCVEKAFPIHAHTSRGVQRSQSEYTSYRLNPIFLCRY